MLPKIIGISGVTGAGKSTLADALACELKSTQLKWDDFDDISTGPADYVDWYHRGRDYSHWEYPALANILQTLKNNQIATHPISNRILQPTNYIIFDSPLGRKHQQTGQYIDICIHISVPLDISLCRRLIRDFKSESKTKNELINEIEYYLHYSRPLFIDDDLIKSADFIIDGMLSTKEQIAKVMKLLEI